MPPGTIYVGRPSVWQNPFVIGPGLDRGVALTLFDDLARGLIHPEMHEHADVTAWMKRISAYGHPSEAARAFLRGRDLCCWCRLDQPCHADIWLEIANQ